MKNKKPILTVLCILLVAAVIGAVCAGLRAAPTVDHVLHISELLQPMLTAQNQGMHISISATVDGKEIALENDIYQVTGDGISYLAIEQGETAVYISENVLFLENGKAFKLGEKLQAQTTSYRDLIPHIGVLYKALDITAEKTETEIVYSVAVTGAQMNDLLAAVSPETALPVEGIDRLNLSLTEENGKLEEIGFAGNGDLDGTAIELGVTISGFRILASGDYPIPDAVKRAVANVDPEELFSLTEDLYRLVLALAPLADSKSLDGTLELTVDCGLIQMDTEINLSDLQTSPNGQFDPEKLRELPEILGLMCMEGDISCTPKGAGCVYMLKLDQQGMQNLSRMILPELSDYGGNLTEGNVTVTLENNAISSMNVSIGGIIKALITQVPVSVNAAFSFD